MAKALKVTKDASVPSYNADKATIVRDFSTFGQHTVNNDARAALLRRVTDKGTFAAIQLEATIAWMVHKGYSVKEATDVMTPGAMRNPNSMIGKAPLRSETQQRDYKRANAAWQYYRECNGVADLKRAKSDKKASRAPRAPGETAKPVSVPVTPQSIVVTKSATLGDCVAQAGLFVAGLARVANVNAKVLQGDKGAALRELAAHNLREMKRIEAMKD